MKVWGLCATDSQASDLYSLLQFHNGNTDDRRNSEHSDDDDDSATRGNTDGRGNAIVRRQALATIAALIKQSRLKSTQVGALKYVHVLFVMY